MADDVVERHEFGPASVVLVISWFRRNQAYTRGRNALQNGDVRRAIENLREAERIKPDWAEANNDLGLALFYAVSPGSNAEALRFVDAAVRLKPGFPEAHNSRSLVLASLARFEEALDACDRAIATRPDYAKAKMNRSVLDDARAATANDQAAAEALAVKVFGGHPADFDSAT